MRTPSRSLIAASLAAATTIALAGAVVAPAASAAGTAATGGPGVMSHFDLARKDCVGTARNTTSKVWFTVANGVLSDVYYPTVDTTNVETLQLVVTDGSTFTDLATRDMTYTVAPLDRSGMSCRVTSTARSGRYTLTTDYLTDPARDSVVMRVRLTPSASAGSAGAALKVYARLDATANGNGGGTAGSGGNGGADDATIDTSTGSPVPVSSDVVTATNAANRDYATPVFLALRADRPFLSAASGFAGTASDPLALLDGARSLAGAATEATHGNAVQAAQLDLRAGRPATLALGFGATQAAAVSTAGATARAEVGNTIDSYRQGWADYDDHLTPPASPSGLTGAQRAELQGTYYTSANVLKASEDKTFPGAIVAGLGSPWGQAVAAGDPNNTYFGSYREVFGRDLYETFTGLMAAGDRATARDTVRFLFDRQQQADGSIPRNSLVNGRTAPDSFGVQLDEVAYPILMARTVGLTDAATYGHVKKAADYLVGHGPAFGSERWEEQGGWSPSTISAEIAGLVAAGALADQNGDPASARLYRATADSYQRQIKAWTLTTTGPLSAKPYFIRLSKTGDPNAAIAYNLGNGGPDADQRSVVDAGFLEYARLGILAPTDADLLNSLTVVDATLRRTTPSGDSFYRYGTSGAGTEDGYGDCHVGDGTSCGRIEGKPWAGTCAAGDTNHGSGHLWPALTAERAEQSIATGDRTGAVALWRSMSAMASGVGLVPEQAWENDDVLASPFGTAAECASIGFVNGESVGSTSPLTWSAASYVRLSADLRAGRVTERPADTTARYVSRTQAASTITLTAPADNTSVAGSTTVTGTAAPGATVDVRVVNTDIDGAATSGSVTAASDGSFSLTLAVPPGTDRVVATATTAAGATAYAQVGVVYDYVAGTLLYDVADPTGDDNGPGTYAYPLSSNFHPGAYDLQRFQVYDTGADSVTFRVQTADLSPTFGSSLGAQLVDVYVNNPAGGATSTAASFPQRNYAVAPWNRLVEVQGFGQRFTDGGNTTVGTVAIRASAASRFITFQVSKTALGGTPSSGWSFAVVLTGQDGFSSDQARGFQPTAQDYQFGVCTAAAAGNPLCAVDPSTVPKAMDVVTPAGVSQATELNPLAGPVVVQAVTMP
jgi:glucoamylase